MRRLTRFALPAVTLTGRGGTFVRRTAAVTEPATLAWMLALAFLPAIRRRR